jgi:hypothetical protein
MRYRTEQKKKDGFLSAPSGSIVRKKKEECASSVSINMPHKRAERNALKQCSISGLTAQRKKKL